jgi:hypothetical protein
MSSRWTEQELDYLANHVGILSYAEMSKRLHRSENAIKLCRCRQGMPTFHNGDYYSCTLLAQELGRSRASIRKYYRRGWLAGRQATWKAKYGKQPLVFLEDHILLFLRKFSHLFDWKKIPNLYFRNVVKELQDG